jgi:alkanesulfonate monooxygenase SsuD/methylene tetrahydromethanopterin reductase-like flavin-dependent oxidoreductase (luciferase family)
MRLGVLIPTRGVVMESARRPDVDMCWRMARLADRAGYDAVWLGDSIVAKPRLEVVTTLAYLAGITERVRLGTAVLLPALRHPVVLANELANVDHLSRGRVVLGLGVGWSLPSAEREWAACGAHHRRRVRRLEEHVTLWRMLWRGEPVTHRGEDVELVEHTIGPLPWNPTGPPVLITAANRGEMLPAQFDRFARLGDGIITTYVDAAENQPPGITIPLATRREQKPNELDPANPLILCIAIVLGYHSRPLDVVKTGSTENPQR